MDLEVNIHDRIVAIHDSIDIFADSLYLMLSNQTRCRELLSKESLSENDIIDVYISLHVVLEVGLNALHRQIVIFHIKKPISNIAVIKNIDNISFIDKTIMFIYTAHFDFGNDLGKSALHHNKVIGNLRNFSGIRNKLIHGHSIGSFGINDTASRVTGTKEALQLEKLKSQIRLFKEINDGMCFFLDHLDRKEWTSNLIEDFKKEYLDYSFIPQKFLQ